jgi:hypothetical protein
MFFLWILQPSSTLSLSFQTQGIIKSPPNLCAVVNTVERLPASTRGYSSVRRVNWLTQHLEHLLCSMSMKRGVGRLLDYDFESSSRYDSLSDIHIVTCILIARQRLVKHMPTVNTPKQYRGCFLYGLWRDRWYVMVRQNSGAWSASELYRPSDRRLSAKLVPTLADRGCCVVSATNSHGR